MRKGNTVINRGRRNAIRVLGAGSATGLAGLLFPSWLPSAGGSANPSALERTSKKKNAVGVHPNWYFFSDANGKPLVFTGSHTWGRRRENKMWVSDGWDLPKFKKYLDFLQHWNHNYTRLWMWEQEGDVNIWEKSASGKYDLSRLNQAFFDLTRSFVATAREEGDLPGRDAVPGLERHLPCVHTRLAAAPHA